MQPHQIENLRRSLAMAPLATGTVLDILEAHEALLLERVELERLLGELLPSWRHVRDVLNEISQRLS